MSDVQSKLPSSNPSLKTICLAAYGLFALGFLTSGVFVFATLAAIIIVYVKRPDAAGTIYASHLDWLMSTFLWSVLWLALSFLLTVILIGWLGILATVVWVLYRLIKGFLMLVDGMPIGR